MPDYSPGVLLAWQIATIETINSSHEFIEREHLFIGLTKAVSIVSQLDSNRLAMKLGDPQALKGELQHLGDLFRSQNIDCEKARRRARHLMGKGKAVRRENDGIHRSASCREAFARAAEIDLQRSGALHCLHLLNGLLAQPGVSIAQSITFAGGDVERLRAAAQKAMPEFVAKAGAKNPQVPAGILAQYGTDLTQLAREGKIEHLVGRKSELLQIVRCLSRKTKRNPLLVGEPGVGKTAMVRALAQRISEGHAPASLFGQRIVEINLAVLVAGTKYRGEFEERVTLLLNEVKQEHDLILFIDEIHTIVGAGAAAGGLDAANIFKPALSAGDLRCIGSTTRAEYRKYFENDAALSRRFLPIIIAEPSPEEAFHILAELREHYEKHHGVRIAPSALKGALDLSRRYILDRQLPDKALDLLDEACVRVKIGSSVFQTHNDSTEHLATVTIETIAEVISERTGIPISRLSAERREKLRGMAEALSRRVVGQPIAVEKVTRAVTMDRTGLRDPNRPVGVFLFTGPTGVGKTEMCRALSEFLFGSVKQMIRLDMSEYKERHSISRLIGAPPGYLGHDEEGQLTGQLRGKPYSVVLLDEIEKAHPEICDLFLQLFDEGRLTDSHGRTVDGKNAIFIMTSNIVATAPPIGFVSPEGFDSTSTHVARDEREMVSQKLSQHFRPEFLNRIDEIVLFLPLNTADLRQIAVNHLDRVAETLRSREIALVFSPEAVDLIVRLGFDAENGARPLLRVIDRIVNGPLSKKLINESLGPGDNLTGVVDGKQIGFVRTTAKSNAVRTK